MALKKVLMYLVIFLLVFIGGFFILTTVYNKNATNIKKADTELEYAKSIAIDKAYEEYNASYKVVFHKHDSINDLYQIGCVNKDDTHAVLYIVDYSKDKTEWFVHMVSARNGSNASELFSVPHIGIR